MDRFLELLLAVISVLGRTLDRVLLDEVLVGSCILGNIFTGGVLRSTGMIIWELDRVLGALGSIWRGRVTDC